jgi:hypothetical protein
MRRPLVIGFILLLFMAIGVWAYVYILNGENPLATLPDITLPGAGNATSSIPGTTVSEETGDFTVQPGATPPRLIQISKGPVALGTVVAQLPLAGATTTDLMVSYIEQKGGNVFRYNTRTGTITRTSNRTVPGIMTAAWLPNASTAFVQYLSGNDFSTVNTHALKGDGSEGFPLPQNVTSLAVSSSSVLTLTTGVNGSIASVARSDGSRTTTAFTTPLTQLRVAFAGRGGYIAFTKPSQSLPGSAFLVNSAGQFTRVAGPSAGLVALPSPSGKWLLVSSTDQGKLRLNLVNLETQQELSLPLATVVDKCVWTLDETSIYCGIPISPSTRNTYPDDWYQGVVSFSDRIWKVDVQGRFAQLVLDFNEKTDRPLDAVALSVDPQGRFLAFVNKIDGSLWGYSL